jgi:DNA polymerase-3 subunit delta'
MNWDMLGHEWAVDLLREHISQGSLRHAYLFTGPQGIGRRTLALRLAQALNCPQPLAPGEPCRTCRTCTQIERMQHPDLAIVQAEQSGGTLKVDQVRELQRGLALAPYEAAFRVAILLRFEEAHPSASNALLKTLEEPPARVVLILTAENSESLLPTVVSRCEVLRLRPLSLETVSQRLQERWGVPREQASLLAHLSNGRPGFALHLYQNPELLEQRKHCLEEHHQLLRSSRVQRFNYAEKLAKDKDRLRNTLQTWLSLWRDVLIQAAGASEPLINQDYAGEIDELARLCGMQAAYRMLAALQRTTDLLGHNVNARLATEVLLLDLPVL